MGYARQGFDVTGVDINPQPNYPFDFVQMGALEFLDRYSLEEFDLVHASPPCQGYMKGSTSTGDKYPRLIAPLRDQLRTIEMPYVIENILPTRPHLINPIQLCGEYFKLGTLRHRLFETSFVIEQPEHKRHRGRVRGWRHGIYSDGPYVAIYGKGGGKATRDEAADAMGIDWMDLRELCEAIPPAYTEWIAKQFIRSESALSFEEPTSTLGS